MFNKFFLSQEKKHIEMFDLIAYSITILFLVINFLVTLINAERVNFFITIGFLSIGIASFISFVVDKSFVSINKIFSVFVFIFFYLAPFSQYSQNITFWGVSSFDDSSYLIANTTIIVFIFLFYFVYFFNRKKTNFSIQKNTMLNSNNLFFIVFLSAFSLICATFLNEFVADSDSTFMGWILKIFRFLPCISLAMIIVSIKNKSIITSTFKKNMAIFISFLTFVFTYNPFVGQMNRYFLFGGYLIIMFSIFYNFRYDSLLFIAFLLGFGTIFPIFNIFKTGGNLSDISFADFDFFNFKFQDYDAYQMLMSSIKYLDSNGSFKFLNVLTAIFGLIPREIWSSKLWDTGKIIADFEFASFNNLSCPLPSEFLLSYGIIGLLLFSYLFALLCRTLSKHITNNYFIFLVNLTVCGILIIIMRGSLLSTMTFLYAQLVAIIILYIVVKLSNKFYIFRWRKQ